MARVGARPLSRNVKSIRVSDLCEEREALEVRPEEVSKARQKTA